MTKREIIERFRNLPERAYTETIEHPAFDLFVDEMEGDHPREFSEGEIKLVWYFFRCGWECGVSGAEHD